MAVLPHAPDQDGRTQLPPGLLGRQVTMELLKDAAPDRVAFYGPENLDGVPVYVHAKVCVVDDTWASVGSGNLNRRSWTHDSELTAAVHHPGYARELRHELAREHLGTDAGLEPDEAFDAFARSAAALQHWHDTGRSGPRPPGRLRPIADPPVTGLTRAWAGLLLRTTYDPDGRPSLMKLRREL